MLAESVRPDMAAGVVGQGRQGVGFLERVVRGEEAEMLGQRADQPRHGPGLRRGRPPGSLQKNPMASGGQIHAGPGQEVPGPAQFAPARRSVAESAEDQKPDRPSAHPQGHRHLLESGVAMALHGFRGLPSQQAAAHVSAELAPGGGAAQRRAQGRFAVALGHIMSVFVEQAQVESGERPEVTQAVMHLGQADQPFQKGAVNDSRHRMGLGGI